MVGHVWRSRERGCQRRIRAGVSGDLSLPETAGLERGPWISAVGWIVWNCEPGKCGATSGIRVHFAVSGLSFAERPGDRPSLGKCSRLGVAGDHEQQLQPTLRPGVCRGDETGLRDPNASGGSANTGKIASSADWQTTEAICVRAICDLAVGGELECVRYHQPVPRTGAFEQQLSQEDQEQDYDRWCSWQPAGQEFWQILGQWSWNWRLWMGWQQAQAVRQTVWAEGEPDDGLEQSLGGNRPVPQPVLPPSLQFMQERSGEAKQGESDATPAEQPPAEQASAGETSTATPAKASNPSRDGGAERYGPMEVSTEWGRSLGKGKRFGNEDFRIVDEQTVLCPTGHPMYQRTSKQKENGDLTMQFGIKPRLCQSCPVKRQCLSPQSKGIGGRRVTVIRRAISTAQGVVDKESAIVRSAFRWLMNPKPKYEQPIYWCDIAAGQLRRIWHEHLSRQEIEIKAIERPKQSKGKPDEELLSRAQREHRRLSWWERWERNERKAEEPRWAVVLYSGKAIVAGMQILSQRSFNATG